MLIFTIRKLKMLSSTHLPIVSHYPIGIMLILGAKMRQC